MSKKLEITKDGYKDLLDLILQNKNDERELALNKYKDIEKDMVNTSDVAIVGKTAVSFLQLASNCTNEMLRMATEIKTIVYKQADGDENTPQLGAGFKQGVAEFIRNAASQNKQDIDDDDDDN